MKSTLATLMAAATISMVGGAAHAATWYVDLDVTDPFVIRTPAYGPDGAHLVLQVADVKNALGSLDILGVSGNVGSDTVSGIVANPNQPDFFDWKGTPFIYDNVFLPVGPYFTEYGLLFSGASGHLYNLFHADDLDFIYEVNASMRSVSFDQGVITASLPEPASWTLLVGGFGLAGAAVRRRVVVARQM